MYWNKLFILLPVDESQQVSKNEEISKSHEVSKSQKVSKKNGRINPSATNAFDIETSQESINIDMSPDLLDSSSTVMEEITIKEEFNELSYFAY